MKLNMEQRRIVELEPNGHMLVKGVAGSGKTTVSIRRVPFLLHHYSHEDNDNILLVTFNKTLSRYIKHQYDKVENEEEYQDSFFETENKRVDIKTIDSLMYTYFKRSEHGERFTLPANSTELETLIRAINEVSPNYPSIKLISPKNVNFLIDEIDWIKASNITDKETYQNIDRIGRANESSDTPQKLIKNSNLRSAIYDLMVRYDLLLESKNHISFKTMNLLALQEAQKNTIKKYTHIIIDESQDLTKVQLEFLKCIYQDKKYSSIMFVADNTQSIYSHSWLGKGRPYTSIGYDMSGRSRTLSKNYRTTTEISTAAYGLIESDESILNNVDFVKPSLIDRQGHPPIYRYFKSTNDQLEFLAKEIECLKNDYGLSDICIVARERRLIENALKYLESNNISCETLSSGEANFESDKVKLVTMHSIKGLEFKVIFIIDLNEQVIPSCAFTYLDEEEVYDSEERRLLYVGMTRANELLYMSSVAKPSKFIKEIRNEHLRMKRDCSIKPFESIGIYEYVLKEQIIDINAKEELVRQWMIRELCKTYAYPLELIELEHPVQQFSKKGYVDIAVNIYNKGKRIPYIFIEIKNFASGIEGAVSQLKSYMEADENVRYGVATDGLNIMILNRQWEVLSDIPRCNPHFLPETKENNLYINFINNRKYLYSYEKDSPADIEISDIENNLHLEFSEIINIPILGEVAAGIPTTVNLEYDDKLAIPKDWTYHAKDTFALKVTGDSMIGAGIDKGDIAIVQKQETAVNGDFVIVLINREATMKKFMLMGDTVLLLPENNNYEPIQMNHNDIRINGKVIGVMKRDQLKRNGQG